MLMVLELLITKPAAALQKQVHLGAVLIQMEVGVGQRGVAAALQG